ncbi:hypothetical protein wVul_0770 [Wolbachia endosymbiont of Armadillidium vulgare str. wVulC]|nr:hypothetical protein wVul_0770 [Wolbachia endosymbiont of Armadillidium vulgare str. wVulC]
MCKALFQSYLIKEMKENAQKKQMARNCVLKPFYNFRVIIPPRPRLIM